MPSFGPKGSDSSAGTRRSGARLLRADLHLHTRHSGAGHLRLGRLRGGLPEPETLYRAARRKGMDLVTFTDLDTLDGCLEFLDRHPDARDFFVSEEVRATEPRTGAVLGVFVYDVSEARHREIQALKGDVRDLAAFLRSEGIPGSLGSVLGLLEAGATEGQVRDLLRQFERFEILNGAEDRACNDLMLRLVQEAIPGGFGVTAGSNAHTPARAGSAATVARAEDRGGFLEALRAHRTWAVGAHGTTWGAFSEMLRQAPLHLSAVPLVAHAVRRARRSAGARRAKRSLEHRDVLRFQEKARSFHASGRGADPEPDEAR